MTPTTISKLVLSATCLIAGYCSLLFPQPLDAHGTLLSPASRVYKCRFEDNPENPRDPACAAAVALAGSSQFLYDWASIRQGSANGFHRQVVPDGELCSGGNQSHAGLDLARGDWRVTVVEPGSEGNFELIYLASAPHSTQDMLFFVTRPDWDPARSLTWDDLDFIDEPSNPDDPVDPFCHLTSVTLETLPGGQGEGYRMICPVPPRLGRHIIYNVWQRDDSPEAFYACVDVIINTPTVFRDGFESGGTSAWSSP